MLLMAAIISLSAFARKDYEVSGEYTYYAQEGQTLGQVKTLALQLAQAVAISKEFGTIVNIQTLKAMNNKDSQFAQFSDSEVKGVWIKDLSEPEFEILPWKDGNTDNYAVKCTVRGTARELTSVPIDYKVRILCNGFGKNHERTDFKHGDDIYLSFTSPVDGYLAVYLMDADQSVSCVLPYYDQRSGIYEIKANREYRLFSEEEAKGTIDEAYAEGYTMEARNDIDMNMLYVIFSPNKFYKASDREGKDNKQLRNLSFKDFNKWLGKCYSKDSELTVSKYIISIEK